MAVGPKARDPNTPYMVYEFSVNGRVYYTGIGQTDSARATDRWNYVSKQIERLKREGSLPNWIPRCRLSHYLRELRVLRANLVSH
jgi:hypothetical protein